MELYYPISDKYDAYGVPMFRGVPHETWERIRQQHPKLWQELLDLLSRDYPTFAILCQKIWAKKVGHLVPFVFNRVQLLQWDRMAKRINEQKPMFFAILKARQLGMSTLINGWIHWQTWRVRDIESIMVTHDKPLASSFIDRLRIFHEELPKVAGIARTLRAQTKTARVPRDELYYNETRSKATTVVAKNAEARGRSTLHNHLAEFAFYPEASELLGALMPQLPAAGSPARLQCSVIIESTPNGKNDFYSHWQLAKSGNSDWVACFYPWFCAEDMYSMTPPHGWKMSDEQRELCENLAHLRSGIDGIARVTPAQMYWYEYTLETECGGDQDRMDAEYPSDDETCFLLRSRSIFKHDMRYLQATVVEAQKRAADEFKKAGIILKPGQNFLRGKLEYPLPNSPFGQRMMTVEQLKLKPKFVEDPSGPLCLWEPPVEGHQYVIGIDAASGLMESDNSVAEIIDVDSGRQVGEYCGKIPPEELADDAVAMGWWFNCALLYPEINSIGVVAMKRIKQVWLYPKLGREEKWDETGLKTNKYGHFTNHDQKMILVSFMVYCVRNHFLAIASDALLSEMSTFVQSYSDGGTETFEADANNKDDRVMGLALALYAVRQSPKMLTKFTNEPHQVLTAREAGIFDAPTPTKTAIDSLPEDVQKILRGYEILAVPANPLRSEWEIFT